MSLVDNKATSIFFADFLLSLGMENRRRGTSYLECNAQSTYWRPVATRTGGLKLLSANDCDGASLLRRLGKYWMQRDDGDLVKPLPHLEALRFAHPDTLSDPGEPVSEFIYPSF